MCVGYYNGIDFYESWSATIEPISAMSAIETNTGSPAKWQIFDESVWEEAAWLYNDANVNLANSDYDQLAAWGLFSGASNVWGGDDASTQAAVNAQLTLAGNFVAAYPHPTDSILYSQIEIYVPLSGWPAGDDVPQVFIGYAPEPSSLILLGSGLLGLAGIFYRKSRSVL
jgi:hypothetical protein